MLLGAVDQQKGNGVRIRDAEVILLIINSSVSSRALDVFDRVDRQGVLVAIQLETQFAQDGEACGQPGEGVGYVRGTRWRRGKPRMGSPQNTSRFDGRSAELVPERRSLVVSEGGNTAVQAFAFDGLSKYGVAVSAQVGID